MQKTSTVLPKTPVRLLDHKAVSEDNTEKELPWYFDAGTYGGIVVLTVLGLTVPFVAYSLFLALGLDPNRTGVVMSGIIVVGSILLWTFSYVFRVFNKDMTYAQQLKNYEDAVIQKRFEELDDDEVAALMLEVEREQAAEDIRALEN